MPLPHKGDNIFNILHSTGTAKEWLKDEFPEVKTENGVLIIKRIKTAYLENGEDVYINDIEESEDNCRKIIEEFSKVIKIHPGIITYWKYIKI